MKTVNGKQVSAWKEIDRVVDVYPTCEAEGSGHIIEQCELCGDTRTSDIPWVLEAQGHNWGEEQVRYEYLVNLDEDLNLIDEKIDGTYDEVTYRVCTNVDRNTGEPCEEELIVKTVAKVVYSKKVVEATITAQEAIAEKLVGMSMSEFRTENPTDKDIELENCNKAGQYQVTYYNAEGKPTSQKWFTVDPHHMEVPMVIEFDTLDDANQCVVKIDEETGLPVVTNYRCYKDITYYEVIHCEAEGCPNKACKTDANGEHYTCANQDLKEVSRVKKVAPPEGDHIINKDVYDEVDAMTELDYADIARLKELAADEGSFIKLSKNTATCEEDGTITVIFLCKVCKAEVTSITLTTKALGHVYQEAVGENVVPPTCEKEGSYDAVIYCKRCGKELERREGVKIPRIRHTNEISVDADGNGVDDTTSDDGAYIVWFGDKVVDPDDGSYLGRVGDTFNGSEGIGGGIEDENEFRVFAKLATNCKRCGNHEVILEGKDATIEITDIQKQGKTCEPGYITLEATFTRSDDEELVESFTVPYWTTSNSYRGRTAHIGLPAIEEEREDGVYSVIYCQICGEELFSKKTKDADGEEVKDGFCLDDDGVWRYYKDNTFAEDFTGIAKYGTGEFFVGNGLLCKGANGLNLYDGTWYFLSDGQIQRGYDGFALYDGAWFIIKDGELDETANGLFDYNGGKFLFAAGKLQSDVNGLWQAADGTWYFLAKGQVQEQYSGVAEYDGAFFVVKDGVFQNDFDGIIEYDGHTFKVVDGQLYDEVPADETEVA